MGKEAQSLWPREHGAYAQLAVALLCGVALGHGSRGIYQAILTVALFLASEPALVLMGRRGDAARDTTNQVRAALRLVLVGSVGLLAAIMAWVGAPAAHLLALVPPALFGALLFGLFLIRQERTAAGEVVAAWAFSACAGTVALLGGSGAHRANLLVLLLAGMFTLATAVVHCHLIALRRGGALRFAAFALGAAMTLGAWFLSRNGTLPRSGFLIFLPMTLAGLKIWAAPPAPNQLKKVGWAAAACAVAGGAMAVFGLW